MKKNKIKIFSLLLVLCGVLLVRTTPAYADWWSRPETRPTQPSIERPTLAPLPTESVVQPTTPNSPTSPPGGQPTVTPPRVGGLPTATVVPSGDNSTPEDPCAAGKSFTGPYCGWSPSPRVGGEEKQGSTGRVLGLSYTSGWELLPSDIILLSGVLCLLLYARSKLNVRRQIG